MNFNDNFSVAGQNATSVFKQPKVPVFQNKVYPTQREALEAPVADVELVQSGVSGFIFNRLFNPKLMHYDQNYQNEQANSNVFQEHLQNVKDLLKSFGLQNKKVVEIGCGKGVFFELLLKDNIDCWGFDPTYEGTNARIIKDYFSEKYSNIEADVIIMRHTLEHIPAPFSFIHEIARANKYRGFLYVEVPTFDWIVEKNAFWDIFYEHCNYFTEQSLAAMFKDAETGRLFGGQYIYLWADLSKLRPTISPEQEITKRGGLVFQAKLTYYRRFLGEHKSLAIWGAGAKGSTFLNLLDSTREYVKYVIDINPVKQDRFVAGTGHPIYSPEILKKDPVETILVMNENYVTEVKDLLENSQIEFFNL
jgi:ubiquinone/menaquinone biosynthesis C-methylase UbiE